VKDTSYSGGHSAPNQSSAIKRHIFPYFYDGMLMDQHHFSKRGQIRKLLDRGGVLRKPWLIL
jgi:hypothetical protein